MDMGRQFCSLSRLLGQSFITLIPVLEFSWHLFGNKIFTDISFTCKSIGTDVARLLNNSFVPGEYPAAMQHGGQLRLQYPFAVIFLSLCMTMGAP